MATALGGAGERLPEGCLLPIWVLVGLIGVGGRADTVGRAASDACRVGQPVMDVASQGHVGGAEAPTTASAERSMAPAKGTATVLVVDDDEAVRESTAAILRAEGFKVLQAADGPAATWVLASEDIDVLLLDLHLRHLDGPAVLEGLEESSTVVVFSAFEYFEEAAIRRDFKPAVFECLRKPVPPSRLVEVIASAVAHRRGHQPRVRPIDTRTTLRLALAGLARVTPEAEHDRS